jgi:two-component system alkaline phosphatase synthesis response regulator PhoP
MAKERILLVENEAEIQQLVTSNLEKHGYRITCADTGEQALSILGSERPDLLLLDIVLPCIDGLQICKSVRAAESTRGIPIIILVAKGKEDDIMNGLTLGADDYLTKPISPKVLLARISVVLRRAQAAKDDEMSTELVRIHNLEIDAGRHEVRVDGAPVCLTVSEFRILKCLTQRPGWVLTRQQVIDKVRGIEFMVTPRLVDVQIFGLRKKLGAAGSLIETVRGIGYRFKA